MDEETEKKYELHKELCLKTDPNKTIRFYTNGLISKWGFEDGDIFDDLCFDNDWSDAFRAMDKNNTYLDFPTYQELLILTVKEFVVPKIKNKIEVHTIGCGHNPIRTETVDGVEIDDMDTKTEDFIKLEPEYVDVTVSEIFEILKRIYDKRIN